MKLKHLILIRLVFALTTGVFVVVPVIIPYYQSKGLTTSDYFLIFAVYHFFSIILELPTGYLSDLWHRKRLLSLGSASLVLANVIVLFSYSLFGMIVSEIFFALGLALYSGTIQAYLYDFLEHNEKQSEAHHQLGVKYTYHNLIQAASFVLGGFLFSIHKDLPQIATIFFLGIGFILTLFLPDIPRKKRVAHHYIHDLGRLVKEEAWRHPAIRYGLLFSALLSSVTGIFYWLIQPGMSAANIPVAYFGLATAGYLILKSFCNYKSAALFRLIDALRIFPLIILLMSFAFITLAIAKATLVFIGLAALAFVEGIGSPYLTHYLSRHADAANRATILSLQQLAGNILGGFTALATSFYIDRSGVQLLSLGLAGFTFLTLAFSWFFFRRHIEKPDIYSASSFERVAAAESAP